MMFNKNQKLSSFVASIMLIVFLNVCCPTFGQSSILRTLANTPGTNTPGTNTPGTNTPGTNTPGTIVTPSMAMSSLDYQVTAGDVYQLSFMAGSMNAISYPIAIDSTYSVRVANLAVINAKGMTFHELKKQVESIVAKNYPMGATQFVLLTPSLFKVIICGEVQMTTISKVGALTRLSNVLGVESEGINSGLLTYYASVRNVKIKNTKGEETQYDLFKAIRDGDLTQDPYLRPDDTITVGRYEKKVTITGAVERPGTYELLAGENLKSLVSLYGAGLDKRANPKRIEIQRTTDKEKPNGVKVYLSENALSGDYILQDRDVVYIPSMDEVPQVAFIEGAITLQNTATEMGQMSLQTTKQEDLVVSMKTSVSFSTDESYVFFIRRNKMLFNSNSDLKNAYIQKLSGECTPVDIENVLFDDDYTFEQKVSPYDTLIIPFKQAFVTVAGAVAVPGRYPYVPDRTWEYYVGLAGGLDKLKNSHESLKIIDAQNNKLSKSDFLPKEATVTASANSFTYYFGIYAPVVTTVLSIVVSAYSIYAVTHNN